LGDPYRIVPSKPSKNSPPEEGWQRCPCADGVVYPNAFVKPLTLCGSS